MHLGNAWKMLVYEMEIMFNLSAAFAYFQYGY